MEQQKVTEQEREALASTMICLFQGRAVYMALVTDSAKDAENRAHFLRLHRSFNANVYQERFIIVGPCVFDPEWYDPNRFLQAFERHYIDIDYESCLEQLLSGENHKVPNWSNV